ncbi:SRPBCC family protein [Streptomyces odontomachi]|uniref:SRPBCC family protein n=1 Tax=Streptomyces odontomachi TaxID=2944940 RepID=UPI002108912E|nr:SRPBCC family protein [Streptomyces sp. ODS25]
MVTFEIARDVPHPVAETWRRLTTWERHADAVPWTRVIVTTPPPTGVGTVFVARSGPAGPRLGRLRVDDPMEVTRWRPPRDGTDGRPCTAAMCRLDKRGRTVLGWAEIDVRPQAAGSRVVWREELRVRGMPRFLDPALGAVARRVFGRAVDRLLAEA